MNVIRDSSSDEETEKIVKRKPKKKTEHADSDDENGGFLSDGYDFDFYGDAEDKARLSGMTEVEREAILYERAQARQARQERRALELRIRERETIGTGKRVPSKEVDLKRKRLDELKAKRQRKLEDRKDGDDDSEEEGEFEDDDSAVSEDEREEAEERFVRSVKKKKSRKNRREDSDEDYYTQDEEESPKNKKKLPVPISSSTRALEEVEVTDEEQLDLDIANKLRLTRDILAQWVYRDGFEEICQKCLLRINLGPGRTGQATYRVVELKKVVQHHRTYPIKPGTPTNLAALVKFAKNERIFSFEFVSNSPFTQSEFSFWKMECEKTGVRIPYTNVSARRKVDKLKAFYAEPLNDTVISNMLERRNELTSAQNAPRNLLAEQTILQQQLKEALERTHGSNEEEVSRIENELAAISVKRQMSESNDRLAVMDGLNRRNRLANLETGRQAEISRLQSELPDATSTSSAHANNKKTPTLDPFQRRKCKPTVIHMNDTETEAEAEKLLPIITSEPIAEISKAKTTNLFDAHDFDLDLDI